MVRARCRPLHAAMSLQQRRWPCSPLTCVLAYGQMLPANEKCISHSLGILRSKSGHVFFRLFFRSIHGTTFSICKNRKPSVLAYREGRSIRLIGSYLEDNSTSKQNMWKYIEYKMHCYSPKAPINHFAGRGIMSSRYVVLHEGLAVRGTEKRCPADRRNGCGSTAFGAHERADRATVCL